MKTFRELTLVFVLAVFPSLSLASISNFIADARLNYYLYNLKSQRKSDTPTSFGDVLVKGTLPVSVIREIILNSPRFNPCNKDMAYPLSSLEIARTMHELAPSDKREELVSILEVQALRVCLKTKSSLK